MLSEQEYLQLAAAFAGSAGFALAYNFRGTKHILAAGAGGSAGWLFFLFISHITGNTFFAGYAATVLVSLYSELAAIILKAPSTGFLIVTSIPMIPGSSLYLTMQHLLRAEFDQFRERGIHTLLFASSMAAGFVTAAIAVHLMRNGRT